MSLASLLAVGESHGWSISLVVLLIKATLILIAALGITLAMQRASAGARHLVWLVTLGALVLIPALTAWGPLRLEILPAQAPAVAAEVPAPEARPSVAAAPVVSDAPPMAQPSPAATVASESTGGALAALRGASVWSILLATWGVVALGILLLLGWSALTVRRLVQRSVPLDDPSWRDPLYEVSDRLGLPDAPRLLLSHDAKMPFACGLLQPTIVLPAECETWSQDRRLAVLLHELAHVRRHDLVGHTLGRLVCAVYWFHPLVWTAARQLRSESERACDDLALACGTRATDYAEHLLDIVTSVRREGTPMVALAMARRKEFEGRMLAILDPELRHSTPSRRQSATLIGTLAMISVLVGAAAPAPKSAPASVTPTASVVANGSERGIPGASVDHDDASKEHASIEAQDGRESRLDTVADRLVDKSLDKSLDKSIERLDRSFEKSMEKSLSRSFDMKFGEKLDARTEVAVGIAVPNAVAAALARPEPSPRASVSDRVAEMVRSVTADAGKKDGQEDERATLLARVLRTDSSASLRRVAAWGLNEYAEQQVAAEALGTALRRDANEGVREMAAWSLGQGTDRAIAVEPLRAALTSDASVSVRKTAAWALGSIGDEGAATTLVRALADASPDVRARAIWALGNIDVRRAPPQLIALLQDRDPQVREITAWALYQIEDPAAAPALQAALGRETDKDLQLKYIRALAAMGEKSVDAIRGLLESSDPQIKSMAVHALAGGHAAGPWPRPMPQPRPRP
jgi:beta-lactamase regulating signal transducer with metallopeptidase domain/HEAT repeat protein